MQPCCSCDAVMRRQFTIQSKAIEAKPWGRTSYATQCNLAQAPSQAMQRNMLAPRSPTKRDEFKVPQGREAERPHIATKPFSQNNEHLILSSDLGIASRARQPTARPPTAATPGRPPVRHRQHHHLLFCSTLPYHTTPDTARRCDALSMYHICLPNGRHACDRGKPL